MANLFQAEDGSWVTGDASTKNLSLEKVFVTVGEREREVIPPPGYETFNIEEWWGKERSFETTVGHIILLSGIVFMFIGLIVGVVLTRNNPKTFALNGVRYEIIGVGEILDGEKKIYSPVYEVMK